MFGSLTLDDIRRDTPGVAHVSHFNNAGSSLPPQSVLDATVGHLQREATIGGYEAADEASDELEAFYDVLADLLRAKRGHLAFIENATRAWDMAVYGYPFRPGDRVLTCRSEYASNLIALLQLRATRGIEIVVVDDDDAGQIDLDALERELDAGAEMVALTHIPTNGGLVNPAEEVGALCETYGVFYVLDACQSAGQVPLDVTLLKCDVLSGTGRKYLRGPRGTGFLYAGPRALERIEPPMLDLHAAMWSGGGSYTVRDDARRFENWETNFAGKLGLSEAVRYLLDVGVERTTERLTALAADMRVRLSQIDGVQVHDTGTQKCGIVTFTVDGVDSAHVKERLSAVGVNTSVSAVTHPEMSVPRSELAKMVRASVHYFNTEEEIDRLVGSVEETAARPS